MKRIGLALILALLLLLGDRPLLAAMSDSKAMTTAFQKWGPVAFTQKFRKYADANWTYEVGYMSVDVPPKRIVMGSANTSWDDAFAAVPAVQNTVTVTPTRIDLEQGGPSSLTITRTNTASDYSQPLTVQYTVGGTAQAVTDYSPSFGPGNPVNASYTFPAGETKHIFPLTTSVAATRPVYMTFQLIGNPSYLVGSAAGTHNTVIWSAQNLTDQHCVAHQLTATARSVTGGTKTSDPVKVWVCNPPPVLPQQ